MKGAFEIMGMVKPWRVGGEKEKKLVLETFMGGATARVLDGA
ncbi:MULTISPECIES: hypothetical protein [Acidiphilium]|nr:MULTISPECIES: hypothetical protein [Acidiphilium]